MSRIAAVTFDAGGTLLEPWPSVGTVYAETLEQAGMAALSGADLDARFREAWADRGAFDYSQDAWACLVRRVLDGRVAAERMDEAFDRLWRRFEEPGAWRVYPDTKPCLEGLRRRGIRLAVVSNWDERLHSVLRGVGLADAFEWILPSIEGPAPKPDPRIFQAAAERLGLAPGAILHVGDSFREDVAGAAEAGFDARWLCRAASAPYDPRQVRSLLELEPLVAA
ncbi:MAG: HAD-IA family hydrolase [Verrucomicrobiae bacterium]|nr:HAD-IA family hydrolase [Verrucomicrobiae bacterium]